MTTGLEEAPGEMAASIAGWFRALADETRIRLMMQLKHHGEMSVGALGAALGLSGPSASKQLAILRTARIVRTRREGTTVYYSIRDQSIVQVCEIVCGTLMEDHRRILRGIENASLQPKAETQEKIT